MIEKNPTQRIQDPEPVTDNGQVERPKPAGPEPNPDSRRIHRLERKTNFLIALSLFQTTALAVLLVMQMIPDWSTIIVMVILLVSFLVAFHRKIPGWIASLFRSLVGRKKQDDSSTVNANQDSL